MIEKSGLCPYAKVELRGAMDFEAATPVGWVQTYTPNFSSWRLGDIVLIYSGGTLKDRVNSRCQRVVGRNLTAAQAQYVHAAIYVGDGYIVDIAPNNNRARRRQLDVYTRNNSITLLRVPGLTSESETAISAEALAAYKHGYRFSVLQLASARLRSVSLRIRSPLSVLSKVAKIPSNQVQAVSCAELVQRVFSKATSLALWRQNQRGAFMPSSLARFAEEETLVVIQTSWQIAVTSEDVRANVLKRNAVRARRHLVLSPTSVASSCTPTVATHDRLPREVAEPDPAERRILQTGG